MEDAFRKSLFQVISLHTSTGFATDDYMLWPAVTWGLLTIVMLMGACAGSTTGGLKCIRMVILGKVARNEFKHILHPNAVLPVRINKQVISPSVQSTVLAFCFIYAVIISVLIMMGLGIGFVESVGCVVSSIGNMGPGLGETGPAFSWNALPDVAKWLLSSSCFWGVWNYSPYCCFLPRNSGEEVDIRQKSAKNKVLCHLYITK